MKVLLDTNMIYNLVGVGNVNISLESMNKLKKFIDGKQVFVTSVTLIEVITKFSQDFINIKKVFTKINEEFDVIQIEFMPFKRKWMIKILSSEHLTDISSTIEEILKLKIMKEAEFVRLYQYAILPIISWTIIESQHENLKENKESLKKMISYIRGSILGNINYNLENNIEYLKNGYREKTPQKIMKKSFSEGIREYIYLFKVMQYCAINDVDIVNIENSTEEQISKVREDLKKDKLVCDIKEGKDIDFLRRKEYRKNIKGSINDYQEQISKWPYFKDSGIVFMYFKNKIDKILLENAKFKNNDISDMLILYSLDFCKDLVLISNDNNLKNFLGDIKHRSFSIINKIIED